MRAIYDTVLWLKSESTGKCFPIVQFSADTDMATEGWVSLTSTERPEIVVTQLTEEEFGATSRDSAGYRKVEQRANDTLKRSDLKCSWLVRVENSVPNGSGLSFQNFRAAKSSPRLLYRDILGNNTVAEVIGTASLSEFEREGGKLVVLN